MSGSRSSAARAQLGIPDGFKVWSAFPFAGVNQSASRIAMDDKQFYWLENFLKVGDGNLRTLWDVGASLYTASNRTIVYPFFYNIGSSQYVALFLSDGTALQINTSTKVITTISASSGLFYLASSGQLPIASQSGTQFLLIANHNTQNDYWIWDGSLLYSAGTIAPVTTETITDGGSGYTSVPTATVFGGEGFGVSLTPVIANGSVVSLTVNTVGGGYLPGDVVQVQFSGGGSDTSPILQAVITAGVVQFITLIAGGTGYPSGTYALGISGGGGSGATGTFTVSSGGVVTSIMLVKGGSGYTSVPTITFPIPGSGGAITATVSGGAVTALTISSGGSGYVTGTYPLSFSGGSGSGASATYTVNASGVISATTLIAGGTGYTSAPTVAIPTGSGATGVASLTEGAVTSVTIVNGGTNIMTAPTLTFEGGGGTGAAATAAVSGGVITSVTVTNGGSGYAGAPAVIVEAGVNNAAAATLLLMPFGVSGTSLETYQSRVWISYPNQVGKQNNGGTFFVSGPGSLTNFATSAGGDVFTNIDRFLRQQYTFLRQTSNFLYGVGDSSVSVVSNVQTTGTPATTTFSYQNSDPQTGTSWRDTAQDYANTILFANAFGVFGVYGGSVRKLSKDIDDIFKRAILPPTTGALVPTSAVANIYNQKVYLLLMTITDPFTQLPRNVMLMWNEKEWFIASQTPSLVAICTQEINSNLTAWGTDGTNFYPLFQTPSTLTKKLSTKMYGGSESFMIKMLHSLYLDASDESKTQAGITFNTASIDASGLAVPAVNSVTQATQSAPSGSTSFNFTMTFQAPHPLGAVYATGRQPQVPAIAMGLTATSQSLDFVVRNVTLGYMDYAAVA